MTLNEFVLWMNDFLAISKYPNDISLNGLQVQNSSPNNKQIKKIAFAVDACLETIEKAIQAHADILFVHHGFFWGSSIAITNSHYKRIKTLLDADMALYACHIPLDAHKTAGNNFGLATKLGLKNLLPFGEWRGMIIGVSGELDTPLTTDEILSKILPPNTKPNCVLNFGPQKSRTIAIVSGGGEDDLIPAIEYGFDTFITGEIGHQQYNVAKEANINVIAAGHYNTETVGVSLVMELVNKQTEIETIFIPAPTGM